MDEIGAMEAVWEKFCSGDDKLRRGTTVSYHLLDDSCV